MSVVFLKVTIKNNENIQRFETKGILNLKSNILIYDDIDKTKNILDLTNNILKRENDDMKLHLCFNVEKEQTAEYILKSISTSFNMKLKTLSLSKSNNKYSVIYTINNTDKIEYIIEMLN